MARLRYRDRLPPGGFEFHQPQTGWRANPHVGFNEVVKQIIQHRLANPRFNLPTDESSVAQELEIFTVERLKNMRGAQGYLIGDVGTVDVPKPMPPPQRSGAVAGADRARAGVSLIMDWLGSGLRPVAASEAEKRADICVKCPLNQRPNMLQRAYSAAARSISLLIQAKNDMRLATAHDGALFTCSACDCDLRLKVWAPMKHILENTDPETFRKLDPQCWIHQGKSPVDTL